MSAGHAPAQASAVSGPVAGIAQRYAGALFDLARESDAIEAIEKDLQTLRAAIEAGADLRAFLKSPVYDADDQMRAITAIVDKAGLSPLTKNFLSLVARNRRLFALEAMVAAFFAILAMQRGEMSAEATSATPLNDEQLKRLRTEIETIVGKAINLTTRVDPELLGGLVVKVGSTMVDSSLKTKLNRIRSVMKEA
ncbi:MAG: F0F1 ATP synthase subunit delta [Parvularculaceae bacterium]